jgi:hypothetical protein
MLEAVEVEQIMVVLKSQQPVGMAVEDKVVVRMGTRQQQEQQTLVEAEAEVAAIVLVSQAVQV